MPLNRRRMQQITPDERYRRMEFAHQQVIREMMACGTHVHVGSAGRSAAVAVLSHSRGYLPMLPSAECELAVLARHRHGFASYLTVLWGRWPSATLPETLAEAAEYDAVAQMQIDAGAIIDLGQVYWDARLSVEHPTAVNAPTGP